MSARVLAACLVLLGATVGPATGQPVGAPATSPHARAARPAYAVRTTPVLATTPAPVVPRTAAAVARVAASPDGRDWHLVAAPTPATVPVQPPVRVASAYATAAASAPTGCDLPVSLLEALGHVETGNLAARSLRPDGRAAYPLLADGPTDPRGRDTDHGTWDRSARVDRGAGPFLLSPVAWRTTAVDLDGDGRRDVQDVDDAAGAVMVLLCSAGHDLATTAGQRAAVAGYDPDPAFVRLVLAWRAAYDASSAVPWTTPLPQVPRPATAATPTATPTPTPAPTPVVRTRPAPVPTPTPTPIPMSTPSPAPSPSPSPSSTPPSCPSPSPSPSPTPSPTPSPSPSPSPSPNPTPSPGPTPTACPAPTATPTPSPTPTLEAPTP